MRQLKHAARTLFKTPFVSVVAIVSLALGIGANTAIFSVFHQVLLRPLPVRQPHRLVNLSAPGPKPGSQSCNNAGSCDTVFSYPMFRDLQREQKVFVDIAAHRTFGANLSFGGQTLSGEGMLVSGSYFPVLDLQPALGRLIGRDDDRSVGESRVVVLSHAYWVTRFDSAPDVLHKHLIVNGQSLTIVGVAAEGFEGTTLGVQPKVFVPITLRGLMQPGFDQFHNRRSYWAYLFARLRPEVTLREAQTALNVPYRNIINGIEAPLQKGMSDQSMARFKAKEVLLEPGAHGQTSVSGEARTPLLLLLGVTALVLIIACANIANLLLARAAARATEMAVRLSLGAGRRQLIGQLLVEACLLAALGGIVGLVVASWTLGLMASMLPGDLAPLIPLTLDLTALVFVAALAMGTGLLFGIFPALHSTRPDLLPTLKGQAGQPGGSRAAARFRTSLATVQIALSMALLASAGLFAKSLYNVARTDLGLDTDNIVTFAISPELNAYTPERSKALFVRLEEELASQPGVTGVAAALVPVLSGSNWGTNVNVEGFQPGPDTDTHALFNMVGPGYFRTLGNPILAGRAFTAADTMAAPKVAIVNEAFASKFNLGSHAVGRRMAADGGRTLDTEIVGLARNAKYSEVKDEVPPLFFLPYRQDKRIGFITFYVKTSLPPEGLIPIIRKVAAGLDPNLPLENLRTLDQQVQQNVYLDRFISFLSTAFAALATLLAAVGLYGILAYTVAQRTREIGLRMALGAAPGRVRRMVLRQVGVMVAVGGLVGVTAAVWIGSAARGQLYRMEGQDPLVLMGSALVLALVALAAGLVPAHRASRVDPMTALRYE